MRMTGKEALKLAQDTILAHNGNNKSSFTMKNLYLVEKELNEKDKKLTKYKRAFDILKRLELKVFVNDGWLCIEFNKIDTSVSKEEAELLEELMMDEQKKV